MFNRNFAQLECDNCRELPHALMPMQCYVHVKIHFRRKNTGSSIEKLPSLVLPGNATAVTAPSYSIFSLLSQCYWSLTGG